MRTPSRPASKSEDAPADLNAFLRDEMERTAMTRNWVATRLGVSVHTLERWLDADRPVPARHEPALRRMFEGVPTALTGLELRCRLGRAGMSQSELGRRLGRDSARCTTWVRASVIRGELARQIDAVVPPLPDDVFPVRGEPIGPGELRGHLRRLGVKPFQFAAGVGVDVSAVHSWCVSGVPAWRTAWVHAAMSSLERVEMMRATTTSPRRCRAPRVEGMSGAELVAAMASQDVTCTELARRLGVTKSTVVVWRSHGLPAQRLAQVTLALGGGASAGLPTQERRAA